MVGLIAPTWPTKPRSRSRRRGADEPGVLAGHPDGQRAVDVDGRHQLRVHLTDEDHAGDVDRLGVGHPQAVAELGHLAEPVHQVADLRPATVDDDGAHADGAHQHDVLRRTGPSASASLAPASALPPYLTTTILPAKRRM